MVVLHHLEDMGSDSFFARRMQLAARTLSDFGIGPRHIAGGTDYWIETFCGARSEDWTSEAHYDAMGRLLAKMHSVPTDWIEASQAEAIERWPLLERVPAGSHAWVGLAWGLWEFPSDEAFVSSTDPEDLAIGRALAVFAQDEELFAEWLQLGALAPAHPAAQRIVTTHGDFHPGNVLECGLVIDFESTCVCGAIYDLAFVVNSEVPSFVEGSAARAEAAWTFVKAYLETVGVGERTEVDDADVELLLLDCMLYGFLLKECGSLFWTNFFEEERVDVASAREHLRSVKVFAERVRAGGAAMRSAVAKGGGLAWQGKVWPCRRVMEGAA